VVDVDAEAAGSVVVRSAGSGPDVVVVPGFVTSGSTPGLDVLASTSTVHLVELPGFGGEAVPAGIRSPMDLACAVKGALRTRGLSGAPVVGQSFGGWVAAELAAMAPVERLVLVDSFGLRIVGEPRVDMFDMPRETVLDLVYADRSKAPTEWGAVAERAGYAAVARFAWNPYLCDLSLPNRLRELDVETLVVWGADDRVVPVSHAALFAELIPGARQVVIPDAGHDPSCDQPDAFARVVGEFLEVKEGVR
jgi:pimeloyl-ACP methyl ester carboxylesterase